MEQLIYLGGSLGMSVHACGNILGKDHDDDKKHLEEVPRKHEDHKGVLDRSNFSNLKGDGHLAKLQSDHDNYRKVSWDNLYTVTSILYY